MAMLVQSDAGVTLVPDAFVIAVIDRIEIRHLLPGGHRMHIEAAYPEGDLKGTAARFLRIASATTVTFQAR